MLATQQLAAGLALLLLGAVAQDDNRIAADDDSRALVRHIQAEWGSYIGDYVELFVGHLTCSRDFVDEDTLNALADDMLQAATGEAVAIIAANPAERLASASDEVVRYAAELAVLSIVETMANAATPVIERAYEEAADLCTRRLEEDRRIYGELQAVWRAR